MSTSEAILKTQYLTCSVGGEIFALEIAGVREVLDYPVLTRIPRTPAYVSGIINLRGSVVPVVDLRMAFGMGRTERTVNTCVVILELVLQGEQLILGALADSVQQVVELDPGEIEPAPRIGTKLHANFIRGIGKMGDSFLILLDLEKVFSDDLAGLAGAAEPHTVACA